MWEESNLLAPAYQRICKQCRVKVADVGRGVHVEYWGSDENWLLYAVTSPSALIEQPRQLPVIAAIST